MLNYKQKEWGLPAKYTILPIGKFEDGDLKEIEAYIAIECKLLKETKKYYINRQPEIEYEVLLKRNSKSIICGLVESDHETDFDESYKETVTEIFDNYEDAKRYSRNENKILYLKNLENKSIEQIDEYIEKTSKIFKEAYDIEDQLLSDYQKTKRLVINQ